MEWKFAILLTNFCDDFTNIGPNLASKIPSTNSSPKDFLSSSLSESISLQPLTVGELNNIVKSFNANKAPGHDNIPMKIIHQSFQNIAQPLVTIINTLLSSGVFPESLKIAKVIFQFLRQMTQHFLVTTGQYQFFQPFLNSLKKSCTTD